jgi:hypothetical protein
MTTAIRRFTGWDVLAPQIVYAPIPITLEERNTALAAWALRLRSIHVRRLSAEAITPKGRQICEKQLKLKMLHERGDGTRVYAGGMRETLRHIQDDLCCFYPGRYVGLMSQYGL